MSSEDEAGRAGVRSLARPSPASEGDSVGAASQGTRAVGYGRVSTREQAENGGSLDAQRSVIEAECVRRGWRLGEVLMDPGMSGKDMRRPALSKALGLLARGDADVLVAAKLDRLSRSVLDFAGLVQRAQAEGWQVVVLDVGADTSTPAGEMLVNVMAAFAQYERRIIGQRTRDGLAVKRAQGVRLGRPPSTPEWVVRRIVRERERGWSLAKIAHRLTRDKVATAQGGKRWYASTVSAVLARAAAPTG